jgi:hypothetical protein
MKMVMTNELANQLMETLVCVAISATGGIIENEDGSFNEEQVEMAQAYAKETFCDILEAWEALNGMEWKIEKPVDNTVEECYNNYRN